MPPLTFQLRTPFMKNLAPAVGLLLLVSCVQMPQTFSGRTPTALPARYDATPYPEAQVSTSLLSLFDDPQLRAVTQRALANNPQIAASAARLNEAGFNLTSTRAPLFPFLSGNVAKGANTPAPPNPNRFRLSLDATWEIDVWGRLCNAVVAAKSDQAAAAADLANVRQSIVAQTTQAWFDTVAANLQRALAQRRAESLAATERLVLRRFEAGTSSLADLELTRSDYQNAKADLESRTDNRDRAVRALKVFMGDYPDRSLAGATTWPALPKTVPAGLPSDILRQRPDIDAAYQRIRAADARIHVAHANLFPSFSLTASAGRSGTKLTDLTSAGSNAASLFGQLTAPVFDAGQRQADLGAAGTRADQAFQDYRGVVLIALREVEDALSSEHYLAREEGARLAALSAAQRSEKRTQRDYEAGLADLLNLLEVQRRVFTTEEQAINLHATRLNNRVSLALALGKAI